MKKPPPVRRKKSPQTITSSYGESLGGKTNSKTTNAKNQKPEKISEESTARPTSELKGFPIVGIGASAGGLEAVTQLLTHLPINTGMGFVLVQHLDPKHESLSAEIFSRVTRMNVTEVKDSMRVQPNCVYIIPPNFSMGIHHGVLNLMPRTETEVRGLHLVIDFFLQSLAEDLKNCAIGVILSGTGSDGTQGLMAIKAEGGFTCAQEPKSAKYDGMPTSAIASGIVDLVLPPKGLAQELARIAKHPYAILPEKPSETPGSDLLDEAKEPHADESLRTIFVLLRTQTNVDFSSYKHTTIHRRIERRIVVQRMEDIASYVKYLQGHPDEVKVLYNDILINVTGFFRDLEVFKELKTKIFPALMKNRPSQLSIRIWVPGCSTGEEVYSIAISLLEFLDETGSKNPIQLFATDISEQAIQKARIGFYSESLTHDLSTKRLNRFFDKKDGGYKISKVIRDMCLFSRHDVTRDPPFSKLDLVSCRNLLIYFSPVLQKRVIPIFHYALNPKGLLLLGRSEGIAGFSSLFAQEDKVNRIYSKINTIAPTTIRFPLNTYVLEAQTVGAKSQSLAKNSVDFEKDADQIVLSQFAPAGAIINHDMEVLQFRGRIGPFLDPAPGQPSYNLLKMVRSELLPSLRMTVQSARKQNTASRQDGIKFEQDGKEKTINIQVIPTNPIAPALDRKYLVVFEEVSSALSSVKKQSSGKRRGNKDSDGKASKQTKMKIAQLVQELRDTKEYQESLAEEYETSQEELTSANEELQSANEELQSTNEELETAKEELQSGNEELTTVNDELQTRSLEQIQTNNDLINLLVSAQIPIVMLGNDRRIRRFTPLAGKALNLLQADVGRPLSDLKINFSAPGIDLNLERIVSEVIETLEPQEVEVRDIRERWFRLQIRPYKTLDGKIDGAVLALTDIDGLKQSLKEVKAAKTEAEQANRAKDLFLATLSHELRTPLTAILSWAQMLQSGNLDAEKIKRGGQVIEDCGKTQTALIDDLLDVSRIIMGKLQLEMSEVHPGEIISKAIDSVRSTADKKFIQIETSFDPQAGTVMADPLRLQQVFLNLLTNAIKFSAPKSKVSVKLTKADGPSGERAKILIAVADSGKGISAEFLPHIFDSFSQEDSSSVRVHGGLGLGLAIVRSLVELHGGSIVAESPGEKRGATFIITLPRKSAYKTSETQSRENEAKTHQTEMSEVRLDGLYVLVVENEASSQEAFKEILQSYGAEVRTTASAQEALEVLQQYRPDVLVSDISMPNEDGYSLIRKVRALGLERGGNVPAVAVTAHAGAADIQRALTAGFQSHLAKPVDSIDLANVIARVAAKKTSK